MMKNFFINSSATHNIWSFLLWTSLAFSWSPASFLSIFTHFYYFCYIFSFNYSLVFRLKKKYNFKFKVILILSPESRPMKYLKFKKVFPALFPSQWSRKIYSKTQVPYPPPLEDIIKILWRFNASSYIPIEREMERGMEQGKNSFPPSAATKTSISQWPLTSHGLSDVPKLTSHRYKYNSLAVTFKALVPVFSPPSSTLFPSRYLF